MSSRCVGVLEAARLLGVSANRFRYYLRAGRVPGAVQYGEGARSVWTVPLAEDGRPVVELRAKGPAPRWHVSV